MFRSKVAWAVIGIVVIGIASAAGALLSSAHIGPFAGSTTVQGQATATTTASATQTATAGATASPTPTAPVGRSATRTPSGQIIDLHGTIVSVNAGSNQFTLKDINGTTWTIQVTENTTYEGATRTFSGLRAGMRAEVSGVPRSATTFHAYHVNADN